MPAFSRCSNAGTLLLHHPKSDKSSLALKCQLLESDQETSCAHRIASSSSLDRRGGTGGDLLIEPSPRSRALTPVRSRSARKSKKPQKSALGWDPNFRGATLWFSTHLHGDKSQLRITSFFSKSSIKKKSCHVEKCRRLRNESVSECKSSSESDDARETFSTLNFQGGKTCASCSTRRTPLWRDAEDGTPLCNACGIRYRKYRLRCSKCWHIPKKDSKTYPSCSMCGGLLRLHQNKKLW